jgi:hypothetical protein
MIYVSKFQSGLTETAEGNTISEYDLEGNEVVDV